jgi:hypothetical protein
LEPEPGAVAGSVVGDDPFAGDAKVGEPGGGSSPELGGGGGLFVVEEFGVDEAGAVIDGAVDEPVAGTGVAMGGVVASPVKPPPAPGGMAAIFLMSTWISSPGRSRW